MTQPSLPAALAGLTLLLAGPPLAASPQAEALAEDTVHWPSFRGPAARGWSEGALTRVEWSVEGGGEGLLFRVPVPGLAHSSPVIWGDRIYLTSAVREGGEEELKVGLYGDPSPVPADQAQFEYRVLCLSKSTGEVHWERTLWKGRPKFSRHPKSSHAGSTPAVDGKRLVVSFGTEGLYALDLEGELLWQRDLGDLDAGPYNMTGVQWGYASSPLIHGDKVLVQCDVLSQGFLAALDVETGEDLWRTPREEVSTWSTPAVDLREGRRQVICNGFRHMGGYDLETGEELWKLSGGGDAPVPTPIVAHDLVFLTNSHGRMNPIYVLRPDAEGELSPEHEAMVWFQPRRGNYMQTPLVYGEELYLCSDAGILGCYDARTGREHYRQRLGEGRAGFTASLVASDGKLYATGEGGEVYVVAAGTTFEVLARNELGETCMATPSISEGVLYWRTRGHLVAVDSE